LFLLFAFAGTNIANIPDVSITGSVNTSNLLYIALCFGFSLTVNAWVFFRVSGGLFNPAVSLGLALVGAITPLRAAILTFAQVLGGITGAAIVLAVLPGSLNIQTALSGGTSVAQGLFLEMFLTSMLMLTIFLLAAEKHKATFLAPIGIGLSLFIAELAGVYYTGGSLNPARSFGPCVVLRSFHHYHWIYWLGPLMGAVLAAGFYKFIKVMQYETVTPDQDGSQETMASTVPSSSTKTDGVSHPHQQMEMDERKHHKPPMTTRRSSRFDGTGSDAGTAAVQGPGISDLLTVPVKGNDVYELPAQHIQPENAMVRMGLLEEKIDLLLAALEHRHPGGGLPGNGNGNGNQAQMRQWGQRQEPYGLTAARPIV